MFDPKDFDRQQFLKSGALFGKKDQVWLFWGQPHESESRPEAVALKCPDFFEKSTAPWLLYPYAMQISRAEAQSLFFPKTTPMQWQPVDDITFKQQFAEIQEGFKRKSLDKVVPYTFETGTCSDQQDFLPNFLGQALQVEKGFLYGQWDQDKGIVGVSPEILVSQINEKHFATMALAGTCSLATWEENPEAFQQDPKEQIEHQKVIEDIVNQLKVYGGVDVHETSIVSTPDLVHMLTPLELKSHSAMRLETLVEKLHPTAALGGYPRKKSMQLLRRFEEQTPRGTFGAPFAVSFTPRSADVVVSIRNISWQGEQFKIGAGCGVVPESQYEKEWQELAHKRNSVKKIFGVL